MKLKELNERNLPSPYYRFEYDDSDNIIKASYSSGLAIYDIAYNGKNIRMMENLVGNRDRIEFEYANGNVVAVNIVNTSGQVYRKCIPGYNSSNQLLELKWEVKSGSNNTFIPEQTQQFSYYPDGNLKELVNHYHPHDNQPEIKFTDRFENYDDKINVDGFSLLHTPSHHLVIFPGVTIQLNNPRRNTRTGNGINYEIDFTYTYDQAGRPLSKIGNLLFTNGQENGTHFETRSFFSYYN
jgi:hypothetical protein